ncbi:MAG TPA: MBL fold metallo-hydrolase [Pseudolabrys sp.]|jgi:L-ascorbate metabolism protein UlaG (beta-lactamase superfamily)|nr:MBL fold metallo-hydrolase [Pseudolabrys sp.]
MSRWLVSTATTLIAAAVTFFALSGQSLAQGVSPPAAKPSSDAMPGCPGLIASRAPAAIPAAFHLAALNADEVRLTYIGHSTFLIESPRRVRVATDYNDYVRPPVLPDIVTMNHAHDTHYTDHPDPRIKYVLRGWAENQKPARIDMQFKDVRVRNVPTNIRTLDGGTERHGNSIFIFETANLCIAHLGHLHHTLTPAQLAEVGKVDVVLVPVDGSYTLDLDGMVEVLHALKAPLMIPMHYFSRYTLDRFLDRVRKEWDLEVAAIPSVVLSKASLPNKPKVMVLPGY